MKTNMKSGNLSKLKESGNISERVGWYAYIIKIIILRIGKCQGEPIWVFWKQKIWKNITEMMRLL